MNTNIAMVDYNNPVSLANYYRNRNNCNCQTTADNAPKQGFKDINIIEDFENNFVINKEITLDVSKKIKENYEK